MAKLIKDDGTEEIVCPKNGKSFSLDELQGYVEGYIEAVALPDNLTMWCNEEGKFDPKTMYRPNEKASRILADAGGIPGDVVMGNVLICNSRECGDEGEP